MPRSEESFSAAMERYEASGELWEPERERQQLTGSFGSTQSTGALQNPFPRQKWGTGVTPSPHTTLRVYGVTPIETLNNFDVSFSLRR